MDVFNRRRSPGSSLPLMAAGRISSAAAEYAKENRFDSMKNNYTPGCSTAILALGRQASSSIDEICGADRKARGRAIVVNFPKDADRDQYGGNMDAISTT